MRGVGAHTGPVSFGTIGGHEAPGLDRQGADQPPAHRAVRFANGRTRPDNVTNNHYADPALARCVWSDGAASHASFAGRICASEFSFRSGNQTGRSKRAKWHPRDGSERAPLALPDLTELL